jgi:hypothetical protein
MYLEPDLLVLPGVLDLDFKGFGRGLFKEAYPKGVFKNASRI